MWDYVKIIIAIFVLWGLVFGYTINGIHHSIDCSCDKGVIIK